MITLPIPAREQPPTNDKSIVADTKNKSGQQDEPAVKSQQPKTRYPEKQNE